MTHRTRTRFRRSSRIPLRFRLGFVAAGTLMLVVALEIMCPPRSDRDGSTSLFRKEVPGSSARAIRAVSSRPQARVIYPYSIIPGGVHSVADLRRAVAGDPVVAAHFARFDLAKCRIVQLGHDEYAYVSYRFGNDVFWTKQAVKLSKGEKLLTDGEHFARTRCGNQVSEAFQAHTWMSEPPAAVLDTPAPPPPTQSEAVAAAMPELATHTPELVPEEAGVNLPSASGSGGNPSLVPLPIAVPLPPDGTPTTSAPEPSSASGSGTSSAPAPITRPLRPDSPPSTPVTPPSLPTGGSTSVVTPPPPQPSTPGGSQKSPVNPPSSPTGGNTSLVPAPSTPPSTPGTPTTPTVPPPPSGGNTSVEPPPIITPPSSVTASPGCTNQSSCAGSGQQPPAPTSVPEESSWVVLAIGLGGLALYRVWLRRSRLRIQR
jgi:hypothetical protein